MFFDLFLLATRWTPEFCYGHTFVNLLTDEVYQEVYPGCEDPLTLWNTTMTLHGLWPQYSEGGYPQFCDSPYGPDIDEDDVDPLMYDYWPNVEADPSSEDYLDFWHHEWKKHGTCTHYDQKQYFQTALDLFMYNFSTPLAVSANVGRSVALGEIQAAFEKPTAVGCRGAYLDQIFTCWDLDFQQVECPKDVLGELQCPLEVMIDSF